jgi:hypothetical protein
VEKSSTKIMANSLIFLNAQSKQSLHGRKITKSGHPASAPGKYVCTYVVEIGNSVPVFITEEKRFNFEYFVNSSTFIHISP